MTSQPTVVVAASSSSSSPSTTQPQLHKHAVAYKLRKYGMTTVGGGSSDSGIGAADDVGSESEVGSSANTGVYMIYCRSYAHVCRVGSV